MNENRMRKRLRQGDVLLGLANMYPAAGIVEGMCQGWDYVWVDGQHGQMSYDAIAASVRAACVVDADTMVRVPSHDSGYMGMCADLMPSAIMVPMINSAEQARAVVRALRFAPHGQRSYGGRRVIDLAGRNYFQDTDLMVVAQIETPEAVQQLDAIAGVEGIDVLFFSPDDMKVQLGLSINTAPAEHAELRQIMQQTAAAARHAGKFAGGGAGNAEALRTAADMGYQMIIAGGDNGFLRTAAAAKLNEMREALGTQERPVPTPCAGVYG